MLLGFQVALVVKNLPANSGDIRDTGLIPGSEDPLEKEMATHSSIFAWRIPLTEEPGRPQSIGSQRVGYDRRDLTHTYTNAYLYIKYVWKKTYQVDILYLWKI